MNISFCLICERTCIERKLIYLSSVLSSFVLFSFCFFKKMIFIANVCTYKLYLCIRIEVIEGLHVHSSQWSYSDEFITIKQNCLGFRDGDILFNSIPTPPFPTVSYINYYSFITTPQPSNSWIHVSSVLPSFISCWIFFLLLKKNVSSYLTRELRNSCQVWKLSFCLQIAPLRLYRVNARSDDSAGKLRGHSPGADL